MKHEWSGVLPGEKEWSVNVVREWSGVLPGEHDGSVDEESDPNCPLRRT